MLELRNITDSTPKNAASLAWVDVTYDGASVFEVVYQSDAIWEATAELVTEENQECYLGYITDQDRFIVGFDTWEAEDDGFGWRDPDKGNKASVLSFVLHQGKIIDVRSVSGMNPMFYGTGNSNLKMLHERFPTLFDIRLD
jgi:hypothetical protein